MKRNKKEDILLNTDNDDISMLAEIQTDPDEVTAMEFNKEIPVMPLRNMVMFPSVVMPVTIGRPSTLKLINAVHAYYIAGIKQPEISRIEGVHSSKVSVAIRRSLRNMRRCYDGLFQTE